MKHIDWFYSITILLIAVNAVISCRNSKLIPNNNRRYRNHNKVNKYKYKYLLYRSTLVSSAFSSISQLSQLVSAQIRCIQIFVSLHLKGKKRRKKHAPSYLYLNIKQNSTYELAQPIKGFSHLPPPAKISQSILQW